MPLDHEALRRTKTGERGGNTWKPKDNANKVRVLPPRSEYLAAPETMTNIAIKFRKHYIKIDGRPFAETTRCLEDLNRKCPACQVWRQWKDSETDPAMAKLADDVKASDVYLMNMMDVNNLGAGVQPWASNWTCWDKIIDICSNPDWAGMAPGGPLDVGAGVSFDVTKTPKSQTKTGWPSYGVMPERQQTNFLPVVEALENWPAVLDELESFIEPAKEEAEIISLLKEAGFPVVNTTEGAQVVDGRSTQPVAAPQPVAQAPVQAPVAAPAAVPGPVLTPATGVAPAPVVSPVAAPQAAPVAAPQAAPVAAPQPVAQPPQAVAPVAHPAPQTDVDVYDPGVEYVPKLSDEQRPAGSPRCYGDYEPDQRPCATCPHVVDCQMTMMGMS